MGFYEDVALSKGGGNRAVLIPGETVHVFTEAATQTTADDLSAPLQPLFADELLTVSMANPFTADELGNLAFWADATWVWVKVGDHPARRVRISQVGPQGPQGPPGSLDGTTTLPQDVSGPLIFKVGQAFGQDVRRYGSLGTDAAVNAATINSALSNHADWGTLLIPATGTVPIAGSLNVPTMFGKSIEGLSREQTALQQQSDNTPIFKGIGNSSHSNAFRKLGATWLNAQTIAQTSSAFFLWSPATAAQSLYECSFEDLRFSRGVRGIAQDPANPSGLIWGNNINRTFVSAWKGAILYARPTPSVGQPCNQMDDIYIAMQDSEEPPISIAAATGFRLGTMETNQNNAGVSIIDCGSGCHIAVGLLKAEGATYTTPDAALILLVNSIADIQMLRVTSQIVNVTTGSGSVYLLRGGGTVSTANIGTLIVQSTTLTAGNQYVFGGLGTGRRMRVQNVDLDAQTRLSRAASEVTPNFCSVGQWREGQLSDNAGDADYTVTLGGPNTIVYSTTLTSSRSVNLPSDVNMLFGGLQYRIVRNAATLGAFDLLVKNGATTVATLGSSNRSFVDVMWRRVPSGNGWVVTGSGALA